MSPAEIPSRNKHPFLCFHPYQENCNLSQPFQSPTWCLGRLLPTPPHHLAMGSFSHNSLGFGVFFPGWLQLIKDLQQDVGITAKPGCRSARGTEPKERARIAPSLAAKPALVLLGGHEGWSSVLEQGPCPRWLCRGMACSPH